MKKQRVIRVGILGVLVAVAVTASLILPGPVEDGYASGTPQSDIRAVLGKADWQTAGLEELELENAVLSDPIACSFGQVYVLNVPVEDMETVFRRFCLAVKTAEQVWLADAGEQVRLQSVVCADVDGEAGEEIILSLDTGGNGGFGHYNTTVWKLTDTGLCCIFDEDPVFGYDTGFTSRVQAPFQLVIANHHTGYELSLDCRDVPGYIGGVFNEDGTPVHETTDAMFDSFFYFQPEDVTGDGVAEIVCKQYTSLYFHADYVGDAVSVLQYDRSSDGFVVIDAHFDEAEDR